MVSIYEFNDVYIHEIKSKYSTYDIKICIMKFSVNSCCVEIWQTIIHLLFIKNFFPIIWRSSPYIFYSSLSSSKITAPGVFSIFLMYSLI